MLVCERERDIKVFAGGGGGGGGAERERGGGERGRDKDHEDKATISPIHQTHTDDLSERTEHYSGKAGRSRNDGECTCWIKKRFLS